MEFRDMRNYQTDYFYYGVDFLKKNNFQVKVLEDEMAPEIAIIINNNFLHFKSRKEAFNYLKPLLITIEAEEERLKQRERVLRELMADAIENVAKRFDKVLYTISIGGHIDDIN